MWETETMELRRWQIFVFFPGFPVASSSSKKRSAQESHAAGKLARGSASLAGWREQFVSN